MSFLGVLQTVYRLRYMVWYRVASAPGVNIPVDTGPVARQRDSANALDAYSNVSNWPVRMCRTDVSQRRIFLTFAGTLKTDHLAIRVYISAMPVRLEGIGFCRSRQAKR